MGLNKEIKFLENFHSKNCLSYHVCFVPDTRYGSRSYGWSSDFGGFKSESKDDSYPNFAFNNAKIRNGFIQKVFNIVTVSNTN